MEFTTAANLDCGGATARTETETTASGSSGIGDGAGEGLRESIAWIAETIERRMREIERTWTAERVLESVVAVLALVGIVLAVTWDHRWLWFSALLLGLSLFGGHTGWTLATRWLRRLGFPLQAEIARERKALRSLRGGEALLSPRASVAPADGGMQAPSAAA